MAISQLSLTDFRNLKSTTLDFHSNLNLISGNNGSGKTSLLEAVFVLCQAQSFRTHQLKQCITHGQAGFLLFGRFDGYKVGISKTVQKLEIHVDGEAVKRRSELVRRAPINIVNANSFDLIVGPPQTRRQFLDWCLFHVEHDYAESWVAFRHAHKQRNHLLKTGHNPKLLDYWDQHLLEPSIKISQMRRRHSAALQQIIATELKPLLNDVPFTLEYQQGWSKDEELAQALAQNRKQDIHAGFTHAGIHRDDLKLSSAGKPAAEILSRGQSKRLCLALLLAVLKQISRGGQNRIILLIDDLHSELDSDAQNQAYQQLAQLDLQLFVSNIEARVSAPLSTKEVKMFHVEHGTIKPRNFV